MKKLLLTTLSILMFFSCSSDDEPQTIVLNWKYKLDGVQYQWSGNYPYPLETSGFSNYSPSTGGDGLLITATSCNGSCTTSMNVGPGFNFWLPENSGVGTYFLNQGNSTIIINSGIVWDNDENGYLSSSLGGNLTVNIIESSNTVGSIMKGTFSGNVLGPNSSIHVVTEGYFEAVYWQ
jgi:hypothetical protein